MQIPESRVCNVKAGRKEGLYDHCLGHLWKPHHRKLWYFRPEGKWGHYLGM